MRSLFASVLIISAMAIPVAHAQQKFTSEDNAVKFCKVGNVVWFNPASKIYFLPGSKSYGKTKDGGFTCVNNAVKDGYKASKAN